MAKEVTFKKTPKLPRRPIKARERKIILAALNDGWSEQYARKKAKVGNSTLQKYKKEHPLFVKKMEDAKVNGVTTLEDAAHHRGVHGVLDPVVSGGKIITYRRKFSDSLLQKALEVRNPKYAVASTSGQDFTDTMVGSAERLLDKLDRIIDQAEAAERAIRDGLN